MYPHPCTPLGAHFQASEEFVERCLRCPSRRVGRAAFPDALEDLGIVHVLWQEWPVEGRGGGHCFLWQKETPSQKRNSVDL